MRTLTRILGAASVGVVVIVATATTSITTSAGTARHPSADGAMRHQVGSQHVGHVDLSDELAQVRRATARFHNLDAALAAGYELGWVNGDGVRIIGTCIAHPTAGAMGYHYFNKQLMDDLAVDPLRPEVLVYERGADGQLELGAVEWVARGAGTNPPGVSEAPTVMGMPMHILNPAVGFYLLHAWIWNPNPAGMFADWNPQVACP